MLEYDFEQGKDDEKYYIPIKNNDTFISKVVTELKVDESFKELTIYGSNEYPLFTLKTIREILEIPKNTLNDQLKNFDDFEIIKNCQVRIKKMSKNGVNFLKKDNDVFLLTKYGLYRAMFISNKPIAKAFRKFVYIILDKLEKQGNVELQDAIDATKKILYKVEDERDKLLEKNGVQKYHLNRLQSLDECLADKETFTMSGSVDYMNFCALKELFLTKTPIYIVNHHHVLSKYLTSEKKKLKPENPSPENPSPENPTPKT